MNEKLEILIKEDGTVVSPYSDTLPELTDDMGGKIVGIARNSHVEWESSEWESSGWVVRSAKSHLAICRHPIDKSLYVQDVHDAPVAIFKTRGEAIEAELKFFWELYGDIHD